MLLVAVTRDLAGTLDARTIVGELPESSMAGAAEGPTWRRRGDDPTRGIRRALERTPDVVSRQIHGGNRESGSPAKNSRMVPPGGPPDGLRRDAASALRDDLLPDGKGRIHPADQRARESRVSHVSGDRYVPLRFLGGGLYGEHIGRAASRFGVDPDLVRAVIATESNFDPAAVSAKGARG